MQDMAGTCVVVAAQFAQQICGISPGMLCFCWRSAPRLTTSHVLFDQVLAPVFQGNSKLIALTVMAVGSPFDFVPGLLPSVRTPLHPYPSACSSSVGRIQRLLLISSFGTSLTALLLGIGLNAHDRALSAMSVFAFALSFSIGLAPIPWVVLSEVVPPEARTADGAVAVSVNWLTNFAAGSYYISLRSQADRKGAVFLPSQ
jgi:hypothetical protein